MRIKPPLKSMTYLWFGHGGGLPSRCHPFCALAMGLPDVAWGTAQQDIGWIEQRAAVLQLNDMVAIDATTFAAIWCCAVRVFTAPATLLDDGSYQRSPFPR